MSAEQRGLCQHCGMWAYWDGARWRHERTRLAACPNGRTNADVDRAANQVTATPRPAVTAPAWMGLTGDHLIETCPHRARSRPTLERHGWWQQVVGKVDPDGEDLCGWCVRVWKARNRKATT